MNSLISSIQEMSNEELENLPNKDVLLSLTQSLVKQDGYINFSTPAKNQTSIFVRCLDEDGFNYVPL